MILIQYIIHSATTDKRQSFCGSEILCTALQGQSYWSTVASNTQYENEVYLLENLLHGLEFRAQLSRHGIDSNVAFSRDLRCGWSWSRTTFNFLRRPYLFFSLFFKSPLGSLYKNLSRKCQSSALKAISQLLLYCGSFCEQCL